MRDASFSASKFEDFPEERVASRRRGPASPAQPAFTPSRAQKRTPSALARVFAPQRLGLMLLIGIAGLALIGVPMNALFLQDGRHPAPLFSGRTITPQKAELPEAPVAPARASQTETAARSDTPSTKAETEGAEISGKPGKSDAAALKAILSKADAAIAAKPEKKRDAAPRDSIAAMIGGGDAVAKAKPTASARVQAQAAPAAPAAAHKNQTQAPKASTPAQPQGEGVVSAQRALQRLGYVVKPDGVLTPGTKAAIEKFERDNGLPAKGELTPKIARLLAARAAAPHP